jgi:hypothetical protein
LVFMLPHVSSVCYLLYDACIGNRTHLQFGGNRTAVSWLPTVLQAEMDTSLQYKPLLADFNLDV